jgi:hypothetical protein
MRGTPVGAGTGAASSWVARWWPAVVVAFIDVCLIGAIVFLGFLQ